MSPYHLESQGSCDKLKETEARGPHDNEIQGHGCFGRSKSLSPDALKGTDRSAVLILKTYGGGRWCARPGLSGGLPGTGERSELAYSV